ncbi:MAG: major facilitator superfamily 1 [Thermoleophilia bacterium]|nr:major facilitator superfamily 1 [Thermoleophilia bacterium]
MHDSQSHDCIWCEWHDARVPHASPDRVGPAAVAWSVYDFGYSLFAYVLFARYLGDWIINDLGHPDFYYTTAQLLAAASLFAIMPIAGVIADLQGRHKPLLLGFTLVAAATGAALGLVDPDIGALGVFPVMALAVVSAIATGLTFGQFDPMLATVAPKRAWSIMSGVAVAAGYVGIILWLTVLADKVVGDGGDRIQEAFGPAAGIFLLFALPLFVLVREPHEGSHELRAEARRIGVAQVARERLGGTVGRLRTQPGVLRFLLGRLMYADAVGTVQIYAIVYMSRLGSFGEREKNLASLLVVMSGVLGALGSGWLARRIGPKHTLLAIVPLFAVGLGVVAGAGSAWAIWVLAPIVGIALGTIYTVDRVFMLALTPPEHRGEMFGFFNLIGRAGQALGPFVLWGGVIYVLHDATGWLSALDASRVSLGLLAVSALAGLWVIRTLDDGSRDGSGVGRAPDAPTDGASTA